MNGIVNRVIAAAVILIAALPAFAQTQMPVAGETIEVSLVNVEVIVTRADGSRVHGLQPSDFSVYDEGVQQPITHFAEYGPAGAAAAAVHSPLPESSAADAPLPRRTIVLFIERSRLGVQGSVFEAIKEMLRRSVRPGDAASIVAWDDPLAMLTTVQRPTDDLDALDRALDRLVRGGVRVETGEPPGRPPADPGRERASSNNPWPRSMTDRRDSLRPNPANGDPWALAQAAFRRLQLKVSAVKALIDGLAGQDGRKIMLLAVDAFSSVAGARYFHAIGYQQLPGDVRAAFDTSEMMSSLVGAANAAGVTLYPVNFQGLGIAVLGSAADGDPVTPEMKFIPYLNFNNETPTLDSVARRTGGEAAWSRPGVIDLLPHIESDLSDYYSLAFRAASDGHDRVHHIRVKLDDPTLRVRTRSEFLEKSDASRVRDGVTATLTGADVDAGTLGIRAEPRRHERLGHGRVHFPVTVRFPARALSVLPDGRDFAGSFTLFIAHRSSKGDVSQVSVKKQAFRMTAADLQPSAARDFTYTFDLVTEAGADKLAVGILDEVSRQFGITTTELR